jgi:hypothetical protein
MNTAVETEVVEQPDSSLVIDHGDTRTVDQGQQPEQDGPSELEQHKRARGYIKSDQPAQEQPAAPEQQAQEAPKQEEKKPERWQDPDTGETYDMRHKVARRIKTVLEDRGKERAEKEKFKGEADYWKRRAEELERGGQQPRQETKPQPQQTDDPEPDPADTTKYPEGQFDRAFIRDQARWAARQETNARFSTRDDQAAEARRVEAEHAAVSQWQQTLPEARKKYADFDAVLERIPNTPENAPIVRLMMGSPVGNDVVYVLGTAQDNSGVALMDRYRSLNPEQKTRFLYHIEAQLLHAQRTAATRTATSKTNAPMPTTPVNTSANAAQATDWSRNDDPDQLSRWKANRQRR